MGVYPPMNPGMEGTRQNDQRSWLGCKVVRSPSRLTGKDEIRRIAPTQRRRLIASHGLSGTQAIHIIGPFFEKSGLAESVLPLEDTEVGEVKDSYPSESWHRVVPYSTALKAKSQCHK